MREFYIFPRFWGKVREGVRPICEIKSPPPKTETVKCGQIRSNREFKFKKKSSLNQLSPVKSIQKDWSSQTQQSSLKQLSLT